jgi:hypothetical protein
MLSEQDISHQMEDDNKGYSGIQQPLTMDILTTPRRKSSRLHTKGLTSSTPSYPSGVDSSSSSLPNNLLFSPIAAPSSQHSRLVVSPSRSATKKSLDTPQIHRTHGMQLRHARTPKGDSQMEDR